MWHEYSDLQSWAVQCWTGKPSVGIAEYLISANKLQGTWWSHSSFFPSTALRSLKWHPYFVSAHSGHQISFSYLLTLTNILFLTPSLSCRPRRGGLWECFFVLRAEEAEKKLDCRCRPLGRRGLEVRIRSRGVMGNVAFQANVTRGRDKPNGPG